MTKHLLNTPEEIKEYKEKFKKVVKLLTDIKSADLPSQEERNWEVESLLDEYVEFTGETPDPQDLYLLGDYILADIIKDPTPYKSSNQEYPIQNAYSRKVTPSREMTMSDDILDYLHSKYTLKLDSLYKVSTQNKEED